MSTDFRGSDIEWVIIGSKSCLRRRINLPVKPKVIEEEKGRLVQETAPAGGQERPDEFFAPRIGRRFFLRGKKLTSGSDQWKRKIARCLFHDRGMLARFCFHFLLFFAYPCIHYHR